MPRTKPTGITPKPKCQLSLKSLRKEYTLVAHASSLSYAEAFQKMLWIRNPVPLACFSHTKWSRYHDIVKHSSVAVSVWLEWAIHLDTDVVSLFLAQLGHAGTECRQVQSCHLLIQ